MGTVVKNKKDGKHYVIIGTGFGAYKTSHPSFFGGSLFPHYEGGNIQTAAISDREGNIYWCDTKDLKVISIDGLDPEEILDNYIDKESIELMSEENKEIDKEDKTKCPVCGERITNDIICTNCGTNYMV